MNRTVPRLLCLATVLSLAACGSGPRDTARLSSAAAACGAAATGAGSATGAETNPPGDIPDNQAFVSYSPPDGLYSVEVPEDWARTESAGRVSFTDKLNAIDIVVVDAATTPTVESAKADEVPPIAAAAPCFRLGAVRTVTRHAGTAVLITYGADSAPDPVTGKVVHDDVERYELWADGREAVLTLSGPAGSDNVDPWKVVTDSFTWR